MISRCRDMAPTPRPRFQLPTSSLAMHPFVAPFRNPFNRLALTSLLIFSHRYVENVVSVSPCGSHAHIPLVLGLADCHQGNGYDLYCQDGIRKDMWVLTSSHASTSSEKVHFKKPRLARVGTDPRIGGPNYGGGSKVWTCTRSSKRLLLWRLAQIPTNCSSTTGCRMHHCHAGPIE